MTTIIDKKEIIKFYHHSDVYINKHHFFFNDPFRHN